VTMLSSSMKKKFVLSTLFVATFLFCSFFSPVSSSESVVSLTPENFDENVGGPRPAFVEFYAPWCGHCQHLAPEYENVGKAFEGSKVVVAKVDCDAHGELCGKYRGSRVSNSEVVPGEQQ